MGVRGGNDFLFGYRERLGKGKKMQSKGVIFSFLFSLARSFI